jgi:integrase
VLTADQLQQVLSSRLPPRGLVLIMFIADSGLRRAEACALNWEDNDFASGLVRVPRGKGGKARAAVIGAGTRRALLSYPSNRSKPGRSLSGPPSSIWDTSHRRRGLAAISATKSSYGHSCDAHALRRTFVILSLRGGMDVLHLQALLGIASLEMVQHYAQLGDVDLLQAHQERSPIDGL